MVLVNIHQRENSPPMSRKLCRSWPRWTASITSWLNERFVLHLQTMNLYFLMNAWLRVTVLVNVCQRAKSPSVSRRLCRTGPRLDAQHNQTLNERFILHLHRSHHCAFNVNVTLALIDTPLRQLILNINADISLLLTICCSRVEINMLHTMLSVMDVRLSLISNGLNAIAASRPIHWLATLYSYEIRELLSLRTHQLFHPVCLYRSESYMTLFYFLCCSVKPSVTWSNVCFLILGIQHTPV